MTKLLACSCTKLVKIACSSRQAHALAMHLLLARRQRAATTVQWPACSGQSMGGRHAGLVLRSSLKRSPAAPAQIVKHFKQYLQHLTVFVTSIRMTLLAVIAQHAGEYL